MAIEILGVRVDAVSKAEALEQARNFFVDGKQHMIFTPNPEMLVKAQQDEYFRKVLNAGDLNVCDGFGLWVVMRVGTGVGFTTPLRGSSSRSGGVRPLEHDTTTSGAHGSHTPRPAKADPLKGVFERIPGTDFMLDICRLAAEEGRSVYLLGSGGEEVVKKTSEGLQEQFPELKIVGFDKGPIIHENIEYRISNIESNNNETIEQLNNRTKLLINGQENEKLINQINATKPDILFVAFGMGKQEKWIYENLSKMPSVKIAMGVGGAFDYIAGFDYLSRKVTRAPLLMRKIGLEWLYRLVKQPWRAGRIFNATVRFCILFLRYGSGTKK